MKILLLCNYQPNNAAMVTDHINSFSLYSKHEVKVCSCLVKNRGNFCHKTFCFDDFDVIVIHYSLFLMHDHYISEKTRIELKNFQGVKCIFLQDEYNFVNKTVEYIAQINFDIIFTCVPEGAIEKVYPSTKLFKTKCVNVLTGYVPLSLVNHDTIPLRTRKFDISYRGRLYPLWYGRLGLEKWQIVPKILKTTKYFGLKCNISYQEKDRLYGAHWVNLLKNSIAVLGTESGASVFDFTGDISNMINVYEKLLEKKIPLWKKLFRKEKVLIEQYNHLKKKYFIELEDKIQYAQISPRVFEAMALRTLCILYEGEYSGILVPWRHYIPLKKDHSNISDVVSIIKNQTAATEIIMNAYKEIILNPKYSYKNFVNRIDSIIEGVYRKKNYTYHIDFNTVKKYKQNYDKKVKYLIERLKSEDKKESCFNMVHDPYGNNYSLFDTGSYLKEILKKIKFKLLSSYYNK